MWRANGAISLTLLVVLWKVGAATSSGDAENKTRSQSSPAGTISEACQFPSCKEIAAKFLDRISPDIDPCSDFYEYSCGKWLDAQDDGTSEFVKLELKTREMGKKLLNGDVKPRGAAFLAEAKIKALYKQCTDSEEINRLRGTPIIEILHEFNGGWPFLSPDWDASRFNVMDALVSNMFFGSDPFFSVLITGDRQQPSVNRIVLYSMTAFAKTDILLDADSAAAAAMDYGYKIASVIARMQRDQNQSLSLEAMQFNIEALKPNITDIIEIEQFLGKVQLTAVEMTNDTIMVNKFSLKSFKAHYNFRSAILRNITEYIQAIFAVANSSEAISDDTIIIVPDTRYWPALDAKLIELEEHGTEGRRRMANYIGWKLIENVLNYLPAEYSFDHSDRTSFNVNDTCLDIMKETMPLALGTLFVRDVVPKDMKKNATLMINDIRAGFRELLDAADWMDNATHATAVDKLAKMVDSVAYPDVMMPIQATFMGSILQTKKNNLIRQLRTITQSRRRYDPLAVRDTQDISVINAWYLVPRNALIIPAGILRIPFFETSAPQYLNYGGIGTIIGHEITHGFDEFGAKYDADGVRRVWWTSATVVEHERRVGGMIQQYNQYTVPTGKVNGALTSAENVADNGGMKAALRGYLRYLARPGVREPLPPGMDSFTPLQLFFLSAAQVWCSKSSPYRERQNLLTDRHAPTKWRVNGVVSNIPEFAQSFNCSPDAPMNPVIKQAAKFLDRINPNIDPCDDFYEYSCGKWLDVQDFGTNEFAKLEKKTRAMGKKLLSGDVKPAGATFAAETKIKALYKQCTDTEEINRLRSTPIIEILNEFNGGWPFLSPDWDASRFNVMDALVSNLFFGSDPFFSVLITGDVEQPSVNRIVLDSMTPFAKTNILLDEDAAATAVMDYRSKMFSVIARLQHDQNLSLNIEAMQLYIEALQPNITDIIEIEQLLGKVQLTAVEMTNDTIFLNKFSLKSFKAHYNFRSAILRNITEYIQAVFAVANRSEAITEDTTIIVPDVRYWPVLDAKLVELEEQGTEGLRRMANYIGWKLIDSVLDYLPVEYSFQHSDRTSSNVNDTCLDIMKKTMPLALGTLYVRDVVPKDMKRNATLMINDIRAGFRDLLDAASWMDNATHAAAVEKLAKMVEIVAYPDVMVTNFSAIDSYYGTMPVQASFMGSILQTKKNNLIRQLQTLTHPRRRYDPLRDTQDISAVNAWQIVFRNTLMILAGILRIPFFEASAPQYLNYGGIGTIIGHEITHGFDAYGAKYDAEGVRRVWWTDATVIEHERRIRGMVQQYNQYTVPTGKVNGVFTAFENVADNGGLKAALRGYLRYLARPGIREPLPPGMDNFTPLQLFFLSAAQVWCSKSSPYRERQNLLTDRHAPPKWRVNGVVSNIPEFAQSFNCSPNSPMNPVIKNGVW
ncbi:uncharacterized protein LOC129601679 isoform X2 [Paramacrobiotus metropolitanus]|uniref:uncharacterized protein LOC129601679 isoform X2 n=1 Tax=Paramacrobiotus metropolitanus TaxID=2943436 RepID=UPI002445AFEE|nr:uncharacterized protein LOC129601679 isoform X2 [Paramacrobiotus metropolitanus]